MKSRCTKIDGYEIVGMQFAAYPTETQLTRMSQLQPSLRAAWNWLCARQQTVLDARLARAQRLGVVSPAQPKPDYSGLSSEEASHLKTEFRKASSDRIRTAYEATSRLPECAWRPHLSGADSEATRLGLKHDYQVVNWHLTALGLPTLPAHLLQKLIKNWSTKATGSRRKRPRKACETMPIATGSGVCFRLRHEGPHNGEIYIPTVGWIAVRVDRGLLGRLYCPGSGILDGVSLRWDGLRWLASIRIQRRLRPARTRTGRDIGIDPGLAVLITDSEGRQLRNPRNLKFKDSLSLVLSIVQQRGVNAQTKSELGAIEHQARRHEARMRNRVHTQLRQAAAYYAREYDSIYVEANTGCALGVGSRYDGATKLFVDFLRSKAGDRLREVESYYNSQDCSQCGHRDKIVWERRFGSRDQTCTCAQCGYTADRDVNAARNVLRKGAEHGVICET